MKQGTHVLKIAIARYENVVIELLNNHKVKLYFMCLVVNR